MLRISVIALSINNLTDARYYAALGVDWLGFNINPASENYVNAAQLKEIIDWVEGPKMLIQDAQWNADAQTWVENEELGISGQFLSLEEKPLQHETLSIFGDKDSEAQFKVFSSLSQWQDSGVPAAQAFINYSGSIADLEAQLELEEIPGLVLYGSNEEAAGIKSFEDLDDVFELLYP